MIHEVSLNGGNKVHYERSRHAHEDPRLRHDNHFIIMFGISNSKNPGGDPALMVSLFSSHARRPPKLDEEMLGGLLNPHRSKNAVIASADQLIVSASARPVCHQSAGSGCEAFCPQGLNRRPWTQAISNALRPTRPRPVGLLLILTRHPGQGFS